MKRRSFIRELLCIAALPLIPISALAKAGGIDWRKVREEVLGHAVPLEILLGTAGYRPISSYCGITTEDTVVNGITYRRYIPFRAKADLLTATGEQQ